jgi:hypothetical protein
MQLRIVGRLLLGVLLGGVVVTGALAVGVPGLGLARLQAQAPSVSPTGGAPAVPPPPTAQAAAPIELTGYWVSVVSEDWRWRMVTPAKGDYASVPLTLAAKTAADTWDPAKDEASGNACRSYGAAGLMRVPTRLHITWQDPETLKVDTDAGMQTRLLRFGAAKTAAASGPPTWQGLSVAEWELPRRVNAVATAPVAGPPPGVGSLKVVTTRLRPGYLRKNGIPYSANTVLTEYWDLSKERNGDQWLVITTVVHDPVNLQTDYITSPNFKKEADGAKWDPTPCSARW